MNLEDEKIFMRKSSNSFFSERFIRITPGFHSNDKPGDDRFLSDSL